MRTASGEHDSIKATAVKLSPVAADPPAQLAPTFARAHSSLAPVSRTIFSHLTASALTSAANSGAVMTSGST